MRSAFEINQRWKSRAQKKRGEECEGQNIEFDLHSKQTGQLLQT